MGFEFRFVVLSHVFEVGDVAADLVQHIVNRSRTSEMGPERPLFLTSRLRAKLVLAILSLLDETVFHHSVKHRVYSTGRGSPPSLCHVLYFVHYLHPVLRRAPEDRQDQRSKPAFSEVSKSTKHSISLFRYWLSDIQIKRFPFLTT